MKLNLDPWQKDFKATKGDKILYCGRQIGKSEIAAEDCGDWAKAQKKESFIKNILMIAPIERQSSALFEKTLRYLEENSPNLIKKGKDRPTQTRIRLTNNVTIYVIPVGVTGLGARFVTVHRLYAEEGSRLVSQIWTAVLPTLLTTGAATIILTTPAGKGTYASDVWNNKNDAFDSFTRFSAESRTVIEEREICKTWTAKQRADAIRHLNREEARMGKLEFAQEYLGKELEDLKQFYPEEIIMKMMCLEEIDNKIRKDKPFMGVDVGGLGEDPSVLFSVNRINQKMYQFGMEITKRTYTTEVSDRIIELEKKNDYGKINVDDGGLGFGVFSELMKAEETRRKTVGLNNAERELDRDGEKSKTIMKVDLHTHLKNMLERGTFKTWKNPEIAHSFRSVQCSNDGGKLKIFGRDIHIVEAANRAAWGMNQQGLNICMI